MASEPVQVLQQKAAVPLLEVDAVEITTLYENIVDLGVTGGGPVERVRNQGTPFTSRLLAEEQKTPFVGGHGLALLVRVTRDGVTRSILFDAGGSPEGLVHNLDCLELKPNEWSCIVLSHGHWDHVLGLIGLEQRLGQLRMPLVLHPDAFLKRGTMSNTGQDRRVGVSLAPGPPRCRPGPDRDRAAIARARRDDPGDRPGRAHQRLRDRLAGPSCRCAMANGPPTR